MVEEKEKDAGKRKLRSKHLSLGKICGEIICREIRDGLGQLGHGCVMELILCSAPSFFEGKWSSSGSEQKSCKVRGMWLGKLSL